MGKGNTLKYISNDRIKMEEKRQKDINVEH